MCELLKAVGVLSAGWALAITTLWALFKYVGKGAIDRYFKSKEVQARHEHEERLKAEDRRHTEHVQQLQHNFDLLARKEDVRFQVLHPDRIRYHKRVHARLLQVRRNLSKYRLALTSGKGKPEAEAALNQSLESTLMYYERSPYYFNNHTMGLIDKFFTLVDEAREKGNGYVAPYDDDGGLNKEDMERWTKWAPNIGRLIVKQVEIRVALLKIEEDLRELLGVEHKPYPIEDDTSTPESPLPA